MRRYPTFAELPKNAMCYKLALPAMASFAFSGFGESPWKTLLMAALS